MKNVLKSVGLFLFILLMNFVYSCKKDNPASPAISTNDITQISPVSAVSGGIITDEGGATVVSKGICWNTSDNPTMDNNKTIETGGSLTFTSNLSQLLPATTYYVRAYAVNTVGTGYGNSVLFKTSGDKPTSTSQEASGIQIMQATLNGTVNPNSLSTTVTFEYGLTTSYGSTSAARQSPLSGDSEVNVFTDLTGLTTGTTYHFRIKTENSLGVVYSSDMAFTTLTPLTDIDGNVYNVVSIGTQVWMAENLKTTKFNNGTDIPLKTNNDFWYYTNYQPGYCWYNNNEAANKNTYGALYNWYAVQTGNLCPTGWHIPSDGEWITLITYVGGENSGGNKLKEAGNVHWSTPSTTATNSYGFTALPGGEKSNNGSSNLGISGTFWSNTVYDFQNSSTVRMAYNYEGITRYIYPIYEGVSVRCLKN